MRCLVLLAAVGLAVAKEDACYQQMKDCQKEGFTNFESDMVDAWGPVMKGKGMMELAQCTARSRCVKDWECMMDAALDFKAGVPECASMAADYQAMDPKKKEKKFVKKMMKLVADKAGLGLFAKAMCHPDDAWSFAKCLKKAVEPAFLVYGPKFLHKSLKKKQCIKQQSDECKAQWKSSVDDACSCSAALGGQVEAMQAAVTDKCGAEVFPDGVEVAKIHAYMSAKVCESKKDKMCYKAAKSCMKESMPPMMKKFEAMGPAKKAQMMLKFMGGIVPKMMKCFADNAEQCASDPDCGMEAIGRYKKKVEGCAGLVQRYAFMPKEAREKKKMLQWVELIFGDDMGPQMMNALCKSEGAATALRGCLQDAVPAAFKPMMKGGLEWMKSSMATCAASASEDCQGRWAAKMADKCSCAQALGDAADDVKDFVANKCGESAQMVDFGAIFSAKKAAACAADAAVPTQ